ncbi:hypothetical protein EMCRGX_G015863 [Ephydatia muelleri]
MPLSQKVNWLAVLVLCGVATSQPCLYNYTIGNGSLPVIVTQSAPVCLICFSTSNGLWTSTAGGSLSGIPGAPYILYVTTPTTTLSGPTIGCYAPGPSNILSSTVHIAAPVVPQMMTSVNEGDPLSLDCSKVVTTSSGAFPLFGQSWLGPNRNIISSSSPTAALSSINHTDTGNYTCVTRLVTNFYGLTTVNASILVVVNYPLSPQPTVYMVQGRTIQLNCTFDGLPAPNVIWTHPNGSVITSQSRFTIQTTSTSSSLTITSLVGGGDNGAYTCIASNISGVSNKTVQLIVQVPPDPPSNVMVTSVGNSSLSLSWTNGFDGFSPLSNVVISYEVDRYSQEGTQAQTFPMGTSATLVGLHPYSNYTLHVSLTNAVGFISNPTNITVTTLSLRPMAPAITSVVAMNSTQVTIMWTKGSRYTFVVFGVNSGGVGDVSLPATNQTPVDSPTVIVSLTAVVMTTTSVNLTWTPPADNGGQNISHYVIQYGILDGNNLTNITNTTTMATQILLSGLTPNSWYLFSVAAHNGFAVGASTLQIKLLVGYPIKPASVLPSVITDTYVNITWQLENPAGFIDYFILSYRLESSQTWSVAAPILSNGTLNYLLTGLSPDTTYVVGVATKNGLQDPSNYTTVTFTTAATPSVSGPTTTITPGNSFTLTCNVGTGYSTSVVWSKDGSTSFPMSAMASGNVLIFTNPQPADSGSYTCSFLGSNGPASAAFVVSIEDDITLVIIIVVVVGGVALFLLILAISVLVCYCCFCRNPSGRPNNNKAGKNSKWTAPVDTTKPKPAVDTEPSPSRPHLTSFHTPAKPAGTLMHQGAITDQLPDSYSGAMTFSTAMSKQPSPPKKTDQMQYAALSFGGGASAKEGGARAMPKSNQDDMVTYSTVETKRSMKLKENVVTSREQPLSLEKERNTSASPVTSMV